MTSEMIVCVLSGNLDKQAEVFLESVKIWTDLRYETDSERANSRCLKSSVQFLENWHVLMLE